MPVEIETPPLIQPDPSEQQHAAEFRQKEIDATFARLVEDLDLSPESQVNEAGQAVLGLVAEAWAQTETLPRAEAIKQREWLTEVTLRSVGHESNFVRSQGLSEYLPEAHDEEAEAFGDLFAAHGQNEMSQKLAASIPAIMKEFRFGEKMPGSNQSPDQPEVEYCVVPEDAAADMQRHLGLAGGALVNLPEGKKGIVIKELVYRKGIEEGSPYSRSFIAHEVSHARLSLVIGEGTHPLGMAINELYAEWAGNDKNAYYDEKHLSNFVAMTGFDIRKEYIPKIASGEMSMADMVKAMGNQFGSVNALRLLAYEPANYNSPHPDDPADIAANCLAYTVQHKGLTTEQIESNVAAKYNPQVANIIVTKLDIRRLIPDNLYPAILARARQNPDFDEKALV